MARSERAFGFFDPRTAGVRRLIANKRGFVGTYDPVGVSYPRLSADELSDAAGECAPFSLAYFVHDTGIEPGSLADPEVMAQALRGANDRIIAQLRLLVARNDGLTILRCPTGEP